MERRTLLGAAIAALALPVSTLTGMATARARGNKDIDAMQARWREFYSPGGAGVTPQPRLERPVQEWKQSLGGDSYRVLFEEDTERPFTSALNNEKRAGVYVCRACELPLFTSEMKYDSGTGWPSFFTAIPGHLDTKKDFKLIWPRTEYHCIKCGGHQGHVFDDGPAPTGERWCNNGVALRFIARASA